MFAQIIKDVIEAPATLQSITSYADALTAAVKRHGSFEIDGLTFERRTDINIPTDYVSTGRHTMVFELVGTGKQYRVSIEPVQDTHRAAE